MEWTQEYELDNILKMSTRLVTLVPRILVADLGLGFLARVTPLLAFPVAGFISFFFCTEHQTLLAVF